MCLNSSNKELISNLKGRISKVLGTHRQLAVEERECLGNLFNIIDEIILHDKTFSENEVVKYKTRLLKASSPMAKTTITYIKEHIIPLVNKVSTSKWGGK